MAHILAFYRLSAFALEDECPVTSSLPRWPASVPVVRSTPSMNLERGLVAIERKCYRMISFDIGSVRGYYDARVANAELRPVGACQRINAKEAMTSGGL